MLLKRSYFQSKSGRKLAVYHKSSVRESQKGIILFHGYAEYTDRYRSFIDMLSKDGFNVFAIDHHGHGRSDGARAYINNFNTLISDASSWFEELKIAYPDYNWYVFGHSMGGGVALDFTLNNQDEIEALVLTGPLIKLPENVPNFLRVIGHVLSTITPKLPAIAVDFDLISRDPDVIRIYKEDPLIYSGNVRARTAIEMDKFSLRIQKRLSELTLPFWVGHGSLDRITDPDGSKKLYEIAASPDKTLKIYPGLFHEILNEPESQIVMYDISVWLSKH
jgi:acylglycerol lipase